MKTLIVVGLVAVILTTPVLAQTTHMPSHSDIYPYTPEKAIREGLTGQATVRCEVQADGALKLCAVISEVPFGEGFGIASIKAAQQLVKSKPPQAGGQTTVDVPFIWNPH